MAPKLKPVSNEEINALLDSEDAFSVAIRGHQAIEALLNLLISERLPNPHVLEIKRLAFALKVDIASALGLIGDRSVFVWVNRIRNRFAHNREARLTKRDIDNALSGATPELRESVAKMTRVGEEELSIGTEPLASLKYVIFALVLRLQAQIGVMRDEMAKWAYVGMKRRQDRANRASGEPDDEGRKATMDDYVDDDRMRRRARGEL